jgi:hypothetical protein
VAVFADLELGSSYLIYEDELGSRSLQPINFEGELGFRFFFPDFKGEFGAVDFLPDFKGELGSEPFLPTFLEGELG